MREAVEKRFGYARTPQLEQPIQWLSGNGSWYRAYETTEFAVRLRLVPYFTPERSPRSNGMAEASVRDFKRDYVYVHDRPDPQTVLTQLLTWLKDYYEVHPPKHCV
jgi:transposase InsO family protein